MKTAFLVLAHKGKQQVDRLIERLGEDFDLYVHIDRRSQLVLKEHPRLFVFSEFAGYWGSENLVLATILLLKEAQKKGYERYVLISGQDIPLRTNEEITGFFEDNGNEYIDVRKLPKDGWPDDGELGWVTRYWPRIKKRSNSFSNNLACTVKNELFKLKGRRPIDYVFYGGSQWFNLTANAVDKILAFLDSDEGVRYLARFKQTRCADELFFQTLIMQLDGLSIVSDCLRVVDWQTGPDFPRTMTQDDYERLLHAKALFARKFDSDIDAGIIESLYTWLDGKRAQ